MMRGLKILRLQDVVGVPLFQLQSVSMDPTLMIVCEIAHLVLEFPCELIMLSSVLLSLVRQLRHQFVHFIFMLSLRNGPFVLCLTQSLSGGLQLPCHVVSLLLR